MILKDGRITILFDDTGLRISVIDFSGADEFVRIKLSSEQTMQALSRMSHTKCEVEVYGLEDVGKKMEHKKLEFQMLEDVDYTNRTEIAKKLSIENCPEGWKSDCYFGSQDSFFCKDDGNESWARTTIRRYV